MQRLHDLRCECSRTPKLATYGIDEDGELFIHIKIWKQKKIYGNVVIKGGEVNMQCRECLRWHKVRIIGQQASLTPTILALEGQQI